MHHNFYLSPLALALVIGYSVPGVAAEALPLQKATFTDLKKNFNIAHQGISRATDGLSFVSEHTDQNQITHVRLQQVYAGFPVFGGYAITHSVNTIKTLSTAASNIPLNGVVYQGLSTELGQPDSSFVPSGTKVLQHFKATFSEGDLSQEKVVPIVFIDDKHQAHWAYQVSVFIAYKDKMPARPTAIIGAKTHKTFVQWDDVKTSKVEVQGAGAGGNIKTGEYQYGSSNFPFLSILRDAETQMCFMENMDVKVVDLEQEVRSEKTRAISFKCIENTSNIYFTGSASDGYDNTNSAFSPSNDALYVGSVIKKMYRDWYHLEALTKSDGSPMKLVMRVHWGEVNASWDGQYMNFGDGDENTLFPLVSIGVGAHEVSHGFTEQHSNLIYWGQSGAMNESFSDMAAQAAEYYSFNKVSWKIGEEIMKGDEAMRYMDKPSRDGVSIDRADEYYGGMNVHYSSGVYNHLFYFIVNQPDWDVRKAFEVMIKANMDYWTPYSTFEEGACGILSAAKDLNYPLSGIEIALGKVGINYNECSVPG